MRKSRIEEEIVRYALRAEDIDRFLFPPTRAGPGDKDGAHRRHFCEWQRHGFSLLPSHYYSPVSEIQTLESRSGGGRRGFRALALRWSREPSGFAHGTRSSPVPGTTCGGETELMVLASRAIQAASVLNARILQALRPGLRSAAGDSERGWRPQRGVTQAANE
jgi:hypothetical protein